MKVVILPGMGCSPVRSCNWYAWMHHALEQRGIDCVLQDFPEPSRCRQSVWLPFVTNEIGLDDQTILVGHSTGACCAMRLLERVEVKGAVLVAVAHTDLGDEHERASEYFHDPWNFGKMRQHARYIDIFHSRDDPLIPVREARNVAEQLQQENNGTGAKVAYSEMEDASHFFEPHQELLDAVCRIVDAA